MPITFNLHVAGNSARNFKYLHQMKYFVIVKLVGKYN